MYKRLFAIKYNNKKFIIFVNEKHRKTFLEEKDNVLIYPQLEDFIELNKIYNGIPNIVPSISRFNFVEKVVHNKKLISLALAIQMGLIIPSEAFARDIDYKDLIPENEISQSYEEKESKDSIEDHIYYQSYEDDYKYVMEHYFNNRRYTREETIEAINNNPTFDNRTRKIALTVLDDMLKKAPNMNLNIYYENMRTLNTETKSVEQISMETGSRSGAYYDYNTNTVVLGEGATDQTIAHEFAHTARYFKREVDGEFFSIIDIHYHFLDEAYTNEISYMSYDLKIKFGYLEEGHLLKYLLNFAPNMTYDDYYSVGIKALSDELAKKYLNVDIYYILDYYQTFHDTKMSLSVEDDIDLEDEKLLDELLKLATEAITPENIEEPFNYFSELVNYQKSKIDKYLPLYNQIALSKPDIQKGLNPSYNNIKDLKYLVVIDGNTYHSLDGKNYYDYSNNLKPIPETGILVKIDEYSRLELIQNCINIPNWNTNDILSTTLRNIAKDNQTYDFVINLSKQDNEKLFTDSDELFNDFKFLYKVAGDNEELKQRYLQSYISILTENGIINEGINSLLERISNITIVNNQIYYRVDSNSYLNENNEIVKENTYLMGIPINNEFKLEIINRIINHKPFNTQDFLNNILATIVLNYSDLSDIIAKLSPKDQEIFTEKLFSAISEQNYIILDDLEARFMEVISFMNQKDIEKFKLAFKFINYYQEQLVSMDSIKDILNIQKLVIVDNNVYISFDGENYLDYEGNLYPLTEYTSLPYDAAQRIKLLSRLVYYSNPLNCSDTLNGYLLYLINDNLLDYLSTISFDEQKIILDAIMSSILTESNSKDDFNAFVEKLNSLIYEKCQNYELEEYYTQVSHILEQTPTYNTKESRLKD